MNEDKYIGKTFEVIGADSSDTNHGVANGMKGICTDAMLFVNDHDLLEIDIEGNRCPYWLRLNQVKQIQP